MLTAPCSKHTTVCRHHFRHLLAFDSYSCFSHNMHLAAVAMISLCKRRGTGTLLTDLLCISLALIMLHAAPPLLLGWMRAHPTIRQTAPPLRCT